jgi:hypothetical protein
MTTAAMRSHTITVYTLGLDDDAYPVPDDD